MAVKAAQCHHLRAAVLFIEEFQEAGVRLEGLLGSTTVSDVVEALRYFVTVRQRCLSVCLLVEFPRRVHFQRKIGDYIRRTLGLVLSSSLRGCSALYGM